MAGTATPKAPTTEAGKRESLRSRLEKLRSALSNERSSFKSHWRDLVDFILPRRGQFDVSETNRGDKRSRKILDTTGTIAARTLASGMVSGVTPPSRPWFRLTIDDQGLAEESEIKAWLHLVENRMRSAMLKSNLYKSLPKLYKDIGVFGTSAMFVEEDLEKTARTYVFPIGSYFLANDSKARVRVFMREYRMTVRQIIEKFGSLDKDGRAVGDNLSNTVKVAWNEGEKDNWIDLVHAIITNPNHDPKMLDAKFKRYLSIYYELGSGEMTPKAPTTETNDVFLRQSGYDIFPVLGVRWEVNDGDVYATSCPGMEALPDIRQLQTMEKRALQAVEKNVNPPLIAPTAMKNEPTSILPGGLSYADDRGDQKGLRPVHQVNPMLGDLQVKEQETRQRINVAFYADLFRQLIDSTRRQITAREVEERHEEKLMALGPVLEQLNQDLLDPLIDIFFEYMLRQGQIPDPPEELQGQDLKVEYISIMAQAQKLAGISTLERFAGFVNGAAAVAPEILDKIDTDQLIDEYADRLSIPPGIVRDDEAVAEIRGARAQAQQAQQQIAATTEAAKAAESLGKADLEKDSALRRLMESQTGPAPAGA